MSFGTGAVTAAVVGGLASGAIGVGGSALMGAMSGGGGGGGGGIDTKSIKETMEAYLAQVRAAIEAGRTQVAGSVKGMDKKIQKGVNELRGASDAETKSFWNNLGISNEGLINTASALVESYDGDVMAALGALETNIGRLNEGYSEDMGAEIARFGSVGAAINAQLAADEDLAETKFLDRVNQYEQTYRQESGAEADAAKSQVFGEDSKFLTEAGRLDALYRGENVQSAADFKAEQDANKAARDAELRASEQTYESKTAAEAAGLEGRTTTLGDTFLGQIAGLTDRAKSETDALRSGLEAGTVTVDSEAEAARSLAFNTRNAAQFGAMADSLSKMAQQTRMDLLATADPRALELSAIADQNAAAMMSGQISADVQANLARSSAMRALGGGFGAGSDMGRGLAARDLGLTSLDLMQRGTQMYDAQRRLNYDTRVAGTQVNPFDVMQTSGLSTAQALSTASSNADMMNRDRLTSAEIGARDIGARMDTGRMGFTANLENARAGAIEASRLRSDSYRNIFDNQRLNTAEAFNQGNLGAFQRFQRDADVSDTSLSNMLRSTESSRNARISAINEAAGQRMQTYDRIFGSNMGVADTLRGQDMTVAAQLSGQRRDDNIRGTGMRIAATQDIYNNNFRVANTVFNAGTGLAGQRLSTGLSVAGDIYKTNVGGAGTVYGSRLGIESGIFDARTRGAIAGVQAITGYENSALQAMSGALGDAAATQANIPVMQAALSNQRAMQSAQLWGSALSSASSLAGSYLGSGGWNQMGGRSFGGGKPLNYNYGAAGNDFWLAG